jgi:putative flippase GtrA
MQHSAQAQFVRFGLAGTVGFLVDTAALYVALHGLGLGHYSGRVFSYLAAATSTWALNRRFTFRAQSSTNWLAEWAKFLAANAIGGLLNYGVYAGLVYASDTVRAWPVLGVAAGSIAGLLINFTLSRRVVFTSRRAVAPPNRVDTEG